ncbi:hypothetical protein INR49_030753 [Caranx melampygus]|nr:hypothetical protein INR49_030753 [Caranx melampygus]
MKKSYCLTTNYNGCSPQSEPVEHALMPAIRHLELQHRGRLDSDQAASSASPRLRQSERSSGQINPSSPDAAV